MVILKTEWLPLHESMENRIFFARKRVNFINNLLLKLLGADKSYLLPSAPHVNR